MNKIYVVDDDKSVTDSLSFFLRASGFTVQAYGSGTDFLADVEVLEAGCLLLDLRMPDVDGLEVIAALSQHRARLPVVIMTGHGDIATAVRAMKSGALDFIEKPFEEDALRGILARAFAQLHHQLHDNDRRAGAVSRILSLSNREREVLHGLICGRSNKVLAYEMGLSVRTIEMHRAAMMDRLGVRNLSEAIRIALDGGVDTATPSDTRAA